MLGVMLRVPIVGAMLLVNYAPSEAITVKQYTMDIGNPDGKSGAEFYAMGVGQGLFWYGAMMGAAKSDRAFQGKLFCLPKDKPFTGQVALEAARRVVDTANGEDIFELQLLRALMETFPCK